jgi:hypothetical protein
MLVGHEYDGEPWFRAVSCQAIAADGSVRIDREIAEHLAIGSGDELWSLPLD